jgi:hypothetical protein
MQTHTGNLMEFVCDPERKRQRQMDESVLLNVAPVLGVWMILEPLWKDNVRGKPQEAPLGVKPVSVKLKGCRSGCTPTQSKFKKTQIF